MQVQDSLHNFAANHVPLERYHASEPEQQAQWSMSVQPAPHVAQPHGGRSRLDCKRVWEDCGGGAAAPAAGAPGARQRNEKSYRRNELCAFVAKCTNEYANQHGTGVDFYTISAHIFTAWPWIFGENELEMVFCL